MKIRILSLVALLMLASNCNSGGGGGCTVAAFPAGVSSAPPMTFYFGATTDNTGTVLTLTTQISGSIAASGCGPFGVWESGTGGGEVATELEIRFTSRMGVFALADGVVTAIQTTNAPFETGEVEGIWVRYGTDYLIKYVHVVNPTVAVGDQITAGQKLGVTVLLGGGQYFWEAELRHKSGATTTALAWSSLLSNATVFNSLWCWKLRSGRIHRYRWVYTHYRFQLAK